MRAFILAALLVTLPATFGATQAAAKGVGIPSCADLGGLCSLQFGGPARQTRRQAVEKLQRETPPTPRGRTPGLSGEAGGAETPAERDWRKRLGDAILDGRCRDAKRIALEYGDVDVALKAVKLCRPQPWTPLS